MRRLSIILASAWLAACVAIGARATGVTNMLLGASGVSTLSTTLTSASFMVVGPPSVSIQGFCNDTLIACGSGANLGSLSAATVGGQTIAAIYTAFENSAGNNAVVVCGFSAEPVQSWLGKVTFNGLTLQGSSGTLSYSSGCATWSWTATGYWVPAGSSYPGTIQYQ